MKISTIFKRDKLHDLWVWKKNPNRKPLLLYGARQVGKTYLLKTFAGEAFTDSVYLNFEDTPLLKTYFMESLQPQDLIYKLSIHFNRDIKPQETLILLDEIQECPPALNSLKYFHETAPEYSICACGSLLGIKVGHKEGFPVGQVTFQHLYPCNFLEFLAAVGEDRLRQYILSLTAITTLPEAFHVKLNEWLRVYYFVGGMPEAIAAYVKDKNFNAVRQVHQDILKTYELDFAKHADQSLSLKIAEVWRSLPAQLAKENKKFVYALIRHSARAREYEEAIQWLQAADLIYKIYHIKVPKIPLKAYAELDVFKIYCLDVGLLNTIAALPLQIILHGHQIFQEFKGSLTENYVFQTLAQTLSQQYYWTSSGTAELDGVIQYEDRIIPLEVKASLNIRSKSLSTYQCKYHPSLAIRTSTLNLKKDGMILNIPLYLLDIWQNFLKTIS